MKQLFAPFANMSRKVIYLLVIGQLLVALMLWHNLSHGLIPKPIKIAENFFALLPTKVFWDNILVSLVLTLKAMAISILVTLFFAYLSVVPFFSGLAKFLVKCRYLTLTGLIFVFTLLTQDGSQLKLSLLVFGIVPFFVTSFLSVITSIKNQEYDLCKTLRYNRWQTLYEVIIIGKADQVLEIIRQNFAISWLMITMVEGLSMSEGGIGTLLIKYNKYNDLGNVLAIQLSIFLLGLFFDFLLGFLKKWLFPYTKLQTQ
ncbi:ABC transporter permease [Pinibacter soli]|uniref:ABC transporter permease subunit n=1 Tax=Pinibacter soli TaxID=3044211 RepID=A0ABT6R7G4_9BACT|nr:ABC transporter permease subunit [Pinibacter soli]MDI3318391.1 ABC transporter permease subunit [Pinibacter soli]